MHIKIGPRSAVDVQQMTMDDGEKRDAIWTWSRIIQYRVFYFSKIIWSDGKTCTFIMRDSVLNTLHTVHTKF